MKRTLALLLSASLLLTPVAAGLAEDIDENTLVQEPAAAAENEAPETAAESAEAAEPSDDAQEESSCGDETAADAQPEDEAEDESLQTEAQDEAVEVNEEYETEEEPENAAEVSDPDEACEDEAGEAEQVEDKGTSSSYAPIIFTVGDENEYQCVVTGFAAEDADEISKLLKGAAAAEPSELKSIVDAEKISLERGTDALLCWAGSSSNMLWMSGWAQQCVNPLTGEAFASEDDVFDYFRSRMKDGGGSQVDGITWFLDGIFAQNNDPDPDDVVAHLKDGVSTDDGLMKDISAGAIMTRYESRAVNCAEMLDTAMKELANGNAVGLCIDGHALTVLGYICDPAAKGTNNYYKSLILADSDNSVKGYTTPSADRPNTATIYTLKFLDGSEDCDGDDYVFTDYTQNAARYLQEYIVLKKYSDETVSAAKETDPTATKNAQTTADLVIQQVYFTSIEDDDQNFCNTNQPVTLQSQGSLYVGLQVLNQSLATFKGDVYAKVTITREDDGERHVIYLPINDGADIDSLGVVRKAINLFDYYAKGLGTYRVTAELNPDDGTHEHVLEAYYQNNTFPEVVFKIIKEYVEKKESSSKVQTSKKVVLIPDNEGICTVPFNDGSWGIHVMMDASRLRAFEICTDAENDVWEAVPEEAYTVVLDTDGTFRLELTEEYAELLGEGVHSFRVNLNGVNYTADITVSLGESANV